MRSSYSFNRGSGQWGFTLIELMIVVVIVAVLAMIAVPSYQEQVLRGKRSDGKAFAMELASRQERFYTQNAKYTNVVVATTGCSGEDCGLGLDSLESPEGHYSASIACSPTDENCTSYTITVTPTFIDDRCTELTYTSAGERGSAPDGSEDYCWR